MRRLASVAILLLLSCALPAPSNGKDKKSDVPSYITHATNVMVSTYHGNDVSTAIPPEDREAMAAVERALQIWGRYKIVYVRESADIIMLVRVGKRAAVTNGPTISIGTPRRDPLGNPRSGGVGVGNRTSGEVGMPDDTLEIYSASLGTDSGVLWRRSQSGGLREPQLTLFKYFREQVELADKEEAAKKKKP